MFVVMEKRGERIVEREIEKRKEKKKRKKSEREQAVRIHNKGERERASGAAGE